MHRSVLAGTTMEVDFGESWVDIAGAPCKVKYLVATLPYSNTCFAKAYPVERLESLLDGIEWAFRYFGASSIASSSTMFPYSTNAKGNFQFDRVINGWRNRPVLDLRLKR